MDDDYEIVTSPLLCHLQLLYNLVQAYSKVVDIDIFGVIAEVEKETQSLFSLYFEGYDLLEKKL